MTTFPRSPKEINGNISLETLSMVTFRGDSRPFARGLPTCKYHAVMQKYGVTHRLSTAYHPQTSGQVEVSNRGLKRILERTIGENRLPPVGQLDDALWSLAAQSYKSPSGVLLTSLCMERHAIFRSSLSTKPIGP
ncbi:reverse transcriptase domain-containing protein [Tanacetum coccineum]|uniref:Reverse transcriptase domain-containing protein n=1 Tax=Tanacetum coccineum TaxID=301880 RepID=A0ABQ4Y6D0_9ASTR